MYARPRTMLLLTCVLAISACKTTGPVVAPPLRCPEPPPLPPSWLDPPNYEQRLRAELLQSEPSATPASPASSPPSE